MEDGCMITVLVFIIFPLIMRLTLNVVILLSQFFLVLLFPQEPQLLPLAVYPRPSYEGGALKKLKSLPYIPFRNFSLPPSKAPVIQSKLYGFTIFSFLLL